jgi:site-specific recombinase XerD
MAKSDPAGTLEGYRFYLTALDLAPLTIKRYCEIARLWLLSCATLETNFRVATASDATMWLAAMSKTRKNATLRQYIVSLHTFYKYALRAKLAKRDPFGDLDLPKPRSKSGEPFSDEELRAMLAVCVEPRDRALFFLLLGGGLRIAEVASVTKDQVDFEAGTIRLLGKGRKWRTVAPGAAAITALAEAFKSVPHFDLSVWGVDYRIKKWARDAGVQGRIHAHRFRYSFAVSFSENGGGVDELQTVLGHSTVTMAMYYSRKGREQRALRAQRRFNPADKLVG